VLKEGRNFIQRGIKWGYYSRELKQSTPPQQKQVQDKSDGIATDI
jgi:hypothetical protein